MTKVCTKCREERPLDKFPPNKHHKDGRGSWCKKCKNAVTVAWSKRNLEKVKKSNKEDYKRHREKRLRKNKQWKKENPDFVLLLSKKGRERFPEKYKARTAVSNALHLGKLIRPDHCSECNKRCKPEAHHEDYSKPLEVVWLCNECHNKVVSSL